MGLQIMLLCVSYMWLPKMCTKIVYCGFQYENSALLVLGQGMRTIHSWFCVKVCGCCSGLFFMFSNFY